MLINSEHYFYTVPTSDTSFTATPGGSLNFNRLFANKPCWEKASTLMTQKKKTLLISDFELSETQLFILNHRLNALVQEGFEVYLYTSVGFELFNKITSSVVITLEPKDLIKQAIEDLNLTHDQLLSMTSNEITLLIEGDDNDWLNLPSFKHADLRNSAISGASLEHFLSEKGEEIEYLNLAGCLNLDKTTLQGIALPKLKSLVLYDPRDEQQTNLSSFNINYLIKTASATLTQISLPSEFNLHWVMDSLATINSIKVLRLNYCELSDINLDGLNVTALEELDISGCDISSQSLEELLAKTTALKILRLQDCDDLIDDMSQTVNLASLEVLDLNQSIISAENITYLLRGAIGIKELNFASCINFNVDMIMPLNLAQLESLKLNGVMHAEHFQKIEEAKGLKLFSFSGTINEGGHAQLCQMLVSLEGLTELALDCIDINDEYIDNNVLAFSECNLKLLNALDLKGLTLTGESLQNLLAHSTCLKSMIIEHGKIDDTPFEPLYLNSLETLSIHELLISNKSLGNLLKNASQLKCLTLNNAPRQSEYGAQDELPEIFSRNSNSLLQQNELDEEDELPETLHLNSLESLYLKRFNIDCKNLNILLANTSNLKLMELIDCGNLDVAEDCEEDDPRFSVIKLHLPSLESINLEHSTLVQQHLDNLLESTQSLKLLNLRHWQPYERSFDLSGRFNFSLLRTLDLSHSYITSIGLSKLLSSTVNLTTLKLNDCKYIRGRMHEAVRLDSLKSLEIVHMSYSLYCIGQILTELKQLRSLDLSKCSDLKETDEMIEDVNLDSLITLKVRHSDISKTNIDLFLAQSPNLQFLDLNGCNFTEQTIEELKLLNPYTTIEWSPSQAQDLLYQQHKGNPESLDADTSFDPDKKMIVQRIFSAKAGASECHVSLYRLDAFNSFGVTETPCNINQAFLLKNASADLQLVEPFIHPQATSMNEVLAENYLSFGPTQEYHATHTLLLSSEWQALPSLSAQETLHKYHLAPPTDVDIEYSIRDNLYYIRKKNGASSSSSSSSSSSNSTSTPILIQIDYSISIPLKNAIRSLPEDIVDKINFYAYFNSAALTMNMQNPTGEDYLNALNQQQVGACRHRTLLFKAWMTRHHPDIPVRIINNECHSFIELKIEGQWTTYNLGGYAAKLVIKEPVSNQQDHPVATIDQLNVEGISSANKKTYFPLEQETSNVKEITLYLHQLLSKNSPCTLIKTKNPEMIAGLRYHLQKHAKTLSRPCFYIQSAEDLICSAPYIERQANNTGVLKKGPGGLLYDFITMHANDLSKPLLIINYDAFNASEIVQVNALLDTERKADGIPLPKDMQIIGLINPDKPEAYDGADFYSRFDYQDTCDIPEDELTIPSILNAPSTIDEQSVQQIEFYGSNAWEERLLGHWSMNGKSLQFKEGALLLAIQAGKTHLNLSNAPWGLPDFESFWQTAILNRQILVGGKIYKLPEQLTLSKSHGYLFDHAKNFITLTESNSTKAYVLNPGLIDRLLGQYQCANGMVHKNAGLIAENKGSVLCLYLSHALSEAAWHQILSACQQHQVHLNLELAPDVKLPVSFDLNATSNVAVTQNWSAMGDSKNTQYICSTDIDATLASIGFEADITIDISEVEPCDLLTKITATFDKQSLDFHFNSEDGVLLKAFEKNQSVILKGRFSQEMQHALVDVLYQRHLRTPLILISTQPNLFSCIPCYQHTVTFEEKKQLLNKANPAHLDDELIHTQSLVALKAIATYANADALTDISLPWMGMETLPVKPRASSASIDLSHAEEKAAAFNHHRLNVVEQALGNSPFVFLAGMSGVGKTSFVKHIWKNKYPALYTGQDQIRSWACDTALGIKTLLIDEANISSRQWSEFEGLFNKKPAILIGNEYLLLTPEHKVIFAGNPLSYGGERQMPLFLKRHGNSVVFDPMSPEYIYQEMLKPVIAPSHVHLAEEIARPILQVADFLTACSKDNVLITPRELVAMVLLTQCYYLSNPDMVHEADEAAIEADDNTQQSYQSETQESVSSEDVYFSTLLGELADGAYFSTNSDELNAEPISSDFADLLDDLANDRFSSSNSDEAETESTSSDQGSDETPPEDPIAQYYAYALGKSLVPKGFKQTFEELFEADEPSRQPSLLTNDFLATQSNQAARDALDDLLNLRKQRQTQHGNDTQQYGGLGGLILEGEPGIGKTELVVQTLVSQGLIKGDINHPATQPVFYIIPASMPYGEKKAALLKAFHEGAVVVMDEINSASMMEGLLNDLLMGQAPDGQRPDNPGFILIGTQNPVTMAGRTKASSALQHRMWNITIPEYQADEMKAILEHKGLPEDIAQDMVQEYIERRKNPHTNAAGTQFCFRHLLKRAEQEIKGMQRQSSVKKRALENPESEPAKHQKQSLLYDKDSYKRQNLFIGSDSPRKKQKTDDEHEENNPLSPSSP